MNLGAVGGVDGNSTAIVFMPAGPFWKTESQRFPYRMHVPSELHYHRRVAHMDKETWASTES